MRNELECELPVGCAAPLLDALLRALLVLSIAYRHAANVLESMG